MTHKRLATRGAIGTLLQHCTILFVLFAGMVIASPARAFYIVAKIERDGNGIAGPSEASGALVGRTETTVAADFLGGFPPTSAEIGASAYVDLATGTMRGHAHAGSPGPSHSIRFAAVLEETLNIRFAVGTPTADRVVTIIGNADVGFAATGAASTSGGFFLEANGIRGAAGYGTSQLTGWTETSGPDPRIVSRRTSGGYEFAITVPPGPFGSGIVIKSQIDGKATVTNGIADVNALNTVHFSLLLPPGATYTSSSQAFLAVPEPGSALLLACGLSWLLQYRRRVS